MPTGSPSAAAAGAPAAATTTPVTATTPATPPSPGSVTAGSGGQPSRLSQTNLYIRGLAPDTTDKDLVTLCQPSVHLLLSNGRQ